MSSLQTCVAANLIGKLQQRCDGLTGCALRITGGHLPPHGQADEGRLGGAHARHQRSLAGAPAAATLHVLLIRCGL